MHVGLTRMQGQFANTLGAQHGNFRAAFGLQSPSGPAARMEIDLEGAVGYSVGLRVEGRRTYDGSVEYLFYDGGEFVERSSGTSTFALSVGLTISY